MFVWTVAVAHSIYIELMGLSAVDNTSSITDTISHRLLTAGPGWRCVYALSLPAAAGGSDCRQYWQSVSCRLEDAISHRPLTAGPGWRCVYSYFSLLSKCVCESFLPLENNLTKTSSAETAVLLLVFYKELVKHD